MTTPNTLKSNLMGLLFTGILMLFTTTSFAQEAQTIKCEVLDMSCYMSHGATGAGHQACAQRCLDNGLPAGILTEDGQVYLLVEDHKKAAAYDKIIKHAADMVKVTGEVVNKNGVRSLIVESVEVLKG